MATENFEANSAPASAPEQPSFDAIGLLAEGQAMNSQNGSEEDSGIKTGDPEGPNTNSSDQQLVFEDNIYPLTRGAFGEGRHDGAPPRAEEPKPRDLETRWRPN